MTHDEIKSSLNKVFQEIFEDPAIVIHESMAAKDILDWDSLNHINLIVAIEKQFSVRFSVKEVNALKNVGGIIALIQKKLA